MELVGDEKRIRALFSELKFADERIAPGFTAVWREAQSRQLQPRRAFNFSFAVATAFLICALATLAIWTKYSQRTPPATAFVIVPAGSDFPKAGIKHGLASKPGVIFRTTVKSRAARLAAQRQALIAANRRAEKNAKEIARWQSPTASLLNSPSDNLFKSLPQLNENANDLKSFLPNRANEKEK
ncbi:MAG TPA: hypothetical protein VFU37_05565 [Pyrinomonadaceae bacterium]|nr:hypothetical protein [Pyrinomonadaceae bacterium]